MNTSNTLAPGTLLNNTYSIKKILGQGGFGITYLAMDVNLNRRVAIKEFFPREYCRRGEGDSTVVPLDANRESLTEDLRKKFVKEARNIALMNHRGIVSIMSAFDQNKTSYYVMEIIDGESFDSIVAKYGPIALDRAVRYMEAVAEALEYVHNKRINHLDIKPSNIMVRTEDNMPILIDFGLSKHYDQSGHATTVSPTGMSHGYAPYEQYLDKGLEDFSPSTDIYSLAATLYYILTGVVPPHAMSLIEGALPFPDNMPEAVKPVITKAMSLERSKRYQTMREFINALKNIAPTTQQGYAPSSETVISQPRMQQPISQQTPMQQPISQPISQQPMQQPISQPISQYPDTTDYEEEGKSKTKLIIIIAVAVVVVGGAIAALLTMGGDKDEPKPTPAPGEQAAQPRIVNDMQFTNSKGHTYQYSGPVDANGVPDGMGRSVNENGTYEGLFKQGVRDGKARCEMKDGSVFEGTYKDDQYEQGRVTWKDGSYYEGTFLNDAFYNGAVYNASGAVETRVKNGKY